MYRVCPSGKYSSKWIIPQNDQPPLGKMTNENVLLKLPNSLRVTDIRWLSVWCTRFTVNYGEVYFPNNVPVPKSVVSVLSFDL